MHNPIGASCLLKDQSTKNSEAGSKAGSNQPGFRPFSGARGRAFGSPLLGETRVEIEWQMLIALASHSISEIGGSDSVRRAREALTLLSRTIPFSIVVPDGRWTEILRKSQGIEGYAKLSTFEDSIYRHEINLIGQIETFSQTAQTRS
jgi:hypothetical protein